ncbi:MAG: histidine phosphatase family protein [Anaerolineaceae bacterium]
MKGKCYRVYLLRHGRSLGNANGFLQGQQDFPLTEEGHKQARLLADRWQMEGVRFDLILSSPLSRARDTAEIIAARLKAPVEVDELLLERDVGSLSGQLVNRREELVNHRPLTTPYRSFSGDGEGDWQLFLRAGQVLAKLLQRKPASYLLVSHGGLLNQLTHAIFGIIPQANRQGVRFKLENTGYSHFDYYPDEHIWDVVTINNHEHLTQDDINEK